MSEHITHLAVAEDSARVATYDPEFSPVMQECIRKFPNALRWGSVSRSGDMFILPSLEKWRDNWNNTDREQEKMAYILGWAGHLAGDRTFKPVFRITDLAFYVRGYPGPAHASIYHDVVTLHETYDSGSRKPFHKSVLSPYLKGHPAAEVVPVEKIENTFAQSFANDLARFRKYLTPDRNKDVSVIENVGEESQRFYVELDRYTDAYTRTDPARMRKYIIEPNLYDRTDPIIQIARKVKFNEKPDIDLKEAIELSSSQSLYAQALALGHQFFLACSEFFQGNISMEEARTRCRTGQPHRESLDYYIKQAEMQENVND